MLRFRFIIVLLFSAAIGGCGEIRNNGGYYEDDGPLSSSPPDSELMSIPDAVPRNEPVFKPSMKPYRVGRKWYRPKSPGKHYKEKGVASWYGRKFHGHKTSNGERYDMYAMTAAHPTLPLPSYVRVTNRTNGRSAIVRVNDRGPFKRNRVIDLSYAAAKKLGVVATGTAPVIVELVRPGEKALYAKKPDEPKPPVMKSLAKSPQLASVDSGIYVQTGVFSVWKNASGQKAKLLLQGLQPVHMRHQQADDGVLYRVLMGPFQSEQLAQEMVGRVISSGISTARVVSF